MRVRSIVAALAALAAVLVLAPSSAEAGAPQNVITATGVEMDDSTCDNPDLRIQGSATGGQPPGEAEERGTSSTLLVDDAGSFEQVAGGAGYPAGPFDYGYGVPLDIGAQPEGTVMGSNASVGDVDDDPLTFSEWFILYRCSSDAANSELLYSCFGPLGDCPANAGEAQELLFDVSVDNATPAAGDTITATAAECFGDQVDFRLMDGSTELDGVDGVAPTDDVAVAELDVPASVAPGTELDVVAECFEDGTSLAEAVAAVAVAAEVTTTTVAPVVPAPAPAARPVAVTPSFTG